MEYKRDLVTALYAVMAKNISSMQERIRADISFPIDPRDTSIIEDPNPKNYLYIDNISQAI